MKAVISLYTDGYRNSAERLAKSLGLHWGCSYRIFYNESSVGSPFHRLNPYAFKVYAFEEALKDGFSKILWVDSSLYAVANVKRIFDIIDKDGYMMQEAGHLVGNWCNDRTLDYFHLSREEAMNIPMFTAGFFGLDFKNPLAIRFFDRWKNAMLNGQFIGSWEDHRHDMTCGSIIAHKLQMKYQPGDTLLQYAAPEDPVRNETIIFKAQGIN